jgi:hypothetical protein
MRMVLLPALTNTRRVDECFVAAWGYVEKLRGEFEDLSESGRRGGKYYAGTNPSHSQRHGDPSATRCTLRRTYRTHVGQVFSRSCITITVRRHEQHR